MIIYVECHKVSNVFTIKHKVSPMLPGIKWKPLCIGVAKRKQRLQGKKYRQIETERPRKD